MSDVCALEGCAQPIEPQPDGAPPRKYCCQAHRTAARARRAAARREHEQLTVPGRLGPSSEAGPAPSEQDLDLEGLRVPEQRDDDEGDAFGPGSESGELANHGNIGDDDLDDRDLGLVREDDEDEGWNEDEEWEEPAFQRIGTAVRRVVDEDSEQQERDHEGAGGGWGRAGAVVDSRSGRESTTAEEGDGADAGDAPVGPGSSSAVSRQPVPLKQLRKRPAWATPKTAVAAGLAAAMVLGGGTALFDISQQTSPEALTPPPLPPGGNQWLDKANIALASTDTQLQMIGAAQQRWQAGAASRRSTVEPPDVKALEARKAYLESQRSILASQVAAWQNLQQNNAALSTANAQLASLTQAADQPGQPGDIQRQIAAQRTTLQARSQMLADQAGKWQQDVSAASSAPMPDTAPQPTTSVVSRVDDLGRGPKPAAPPTGDRGESGSILAGRSPNSGDKERDLPGTAAPPRPDDGSSHSSAEAASSHGGVLAAAGSATKPVTDTVRGTGLLGGGKARPDSSDRSGKGPTDQGASGGGKGLVKPVQRTADQVGGVLGGAVDGVTGHDRSETGGTHSSGDRAQHAGVSGAVGGAVGGLLGGKRKDPDRSTERRDAPNESTASTPAASLLGMRTVGDLVGRAMDAQRAQQDDHADRSTSKDVSQGGHHSALMNLGTTTYRVALPAKPGDSAEHSTGHGSGADKKSGKPSRASKARNSTERQVRAAATSWANTLVGKYAGKSAGSTSSGAQHSDSKHSSSKNSGSKDSGSKDSGSKGLDRLIAKYSGRSSGGGSGSSIKELKTKHSNSKDSSPKDSDSKDSGSKDSGSKDSGSKSSSSKNSGSKGLDRLISKYSGKSSGGGSGGGSGSSIKELKTKHSNSKDSSPKDSDSKSSGSSSKSSGSES